MAVAGLSGTHIVTSYHPKPEMEPFKFMYHGTNSKDEIVNTGFLNSESHFCCTFLNGELPPRSPYGDDILYVEAKYVLSLFSDPCLYIEIDCKPPQDRERWVNKYCNLYLTEGPKLHANAKKGLVEKLDISNNTYLELRMDGDCTVRKNYLGHVLPDGRNIYYWTNVMVEKQVPLAQLQCQWNLVQGVNPQQFLQFVI